MRPNHDAAVAAWVALAETDLRMARLAMQDEPPMYRQVCFHSQQAAEKMLKALLERCELPAPRTHDLLVLIDVLAFRLPQVSEWAEDGAVLSEFGVGPRYPGVAFEATAGQARQAFACAARMMAGIRGILDVSTTG